MTQLRRKTPLGFIAILLGLFCSVLAQAKETKEINEPIIEKSWAEGLHLIAGGGLNTALLISKNGQKHLSPGFNLKTDLAYHLSPTWAVEVGANVMFDRIHGFMVWDTLFTVGVRTLLPLFRQYKQFASYLRFFGGYGPAMVYQATNATDTFPGADRLKLQGPAAGASFGVFYDLAANRPWFIELTFMAHHFYNIFGVKDLDAAPISLSNSAINNNSTLFSLQINAGLFIF